MAKRRKTSHATEIQKSILVACMKEKECLLFDPNFTSKMAQQMWCELSQTLNMAGGAQKNWKSWRKTWTDLKCRTKSKKKQIDRESLKNEGGPQLRPFTALEEIILTVQKKPRRGRGRICKAEISSDSSNDVIEVPQEYEEVLMDDNNFSPATPNTLHMFLPTDPLMNSISSHNTQPTKKVVISRLTPSNNHVKSIPTTLPQLATSSNINVKSIPVIITSSASVPSPNIFSTNQPQPRRVPFRAPSVKKTDECFSDCRHQRMLNEQLKRKNDVQEKYYKKKLEILEQCKDGFLQIINHLMKK